MKYKVGDKVRIKSLAWYNENKDEDGNIRYKSDNAAYPIFFTKYMSRFCGETLIIKCVHKGSYYMNETGSCEFWTDEMIEGLVEEEVDLIPKFGEFSDNEPKDMGEVSDGYHTFNELYEYRMLYNAALFNEFAKQGLYDVHKSRKHSDGEYPFGDSNWFIVMAELPTGQISNHYEMKDWDKFQIPEKLLANKWDEHSPRDVADRLTNFTNPKKEYPKTYEECCEVLGIDEYDLVQDYRVGKIRNIQSERIEKLNILNKLLICRDAYWKIAGEEMGLGKPWEPDWQDDTTHKFIIHTIKDKIHCGVSLVKNHLLAFPTEEMRDAFYENFKSEIESCKELL